MTIMFEIPEALASQLGADSPEQLSRRALEVLLLEAYRTNRIGGPEAAEALGFSRVRWEQFLDEHQVLQGATTVADLERDVATLRRLRSEGVLPPVG